MRILSMSGEPSSGSAECEVKDEEKDIWSSGAVIEGKITGW